MINGDNRSRRWIAGAVVFASFVFCCPNLTPVLAYVTPEIYATGSTINKTTFSSGREISGTISLWNSEQYYAGDLALSYFLISRGGKNELIDRRSGDKFSLEPGEKRDVEYSYWLPYKVPEEAFIFRIGVENSRGNLIAWTDRGITVGRSESPFIYLDYATQTSDNGALQIGAEPQIDVAIKNPSANASSTPAMVLRATTYKTGQVYNTQELALGKITGSTVAQLALPAFAEPGFYRTEARIYNRGSGDSYSNIISYNWKVSRKGGLAQVLYALVDKYKYNKGDTARVKAQIAYLDWPENGVLSVSCVLTGSSVQAGMIEKTLASEDTDVIFEIPVTADVANPMVKITLSDGSATIDSYEFKSSFREAKTINSQDATSGSKDAIDELYAARVKSVFFLALLLGALAALVWAGIYTYKRVIQPRIRKKKDVPSQKSGGDGDNLQDLLKEFNAIDKENKKFKIKKLG